eukprot:5695939-Heterocapsa_arctica.AAC.1
MTPYESVRGRTYHGLIYKFGQSVMIGSRARGLGRPSTVMSTLWQLLEEYGTDVPAVCLGLARASPTPGSTS